MSMANRIVVELDEQDRPTALDGDPIPETKDPRYDYSGLHTWTCPRGCGFEFEQSLGNLIYVKRRHRCP